MGSPTHFGEPVIIFSIVYLGFITVMMSMISPATAACDQYHAVYNDSHGPTPASVVCSGSGTIGFGVGNTFSIGNFIGNLVELKAWNLLIFGPVIAALIYIIVFPLIPGWI